MTSKPTSQDDTRVSALRHDLGTQIEKAMAQVKAQLARIEAMGDAPEVAGPAQDLQAVLSQLDAQQQDIAGASVVHLLALQVSVPLSIGTITDHARQITQTARGQAAHHVMELTREQLAALDQRHAAASARFQSFETSLFTHMDALAAENGVDVSRFHAVRDQLQAEYAAAKARGDLLAMAEADALRATDLRMGLETVGANPEEIEKARREEAARERDFLERAAIEARRRGEAQGQTGEDLQAHVEGSVTSSQARLQQRKTEMAEAHDTTASFEVEQAAQEAKRAKTKDALVNPFALPVAPDAPLEVAEAGEAPDQPPSSLVAPATGRPRPPRSLR